MGVSAGFNIEVQLVAPQNVETWVTAGATKGYSRRLFSMEQERILFSERTLLCNVRQ